MFRLKKADSISGWSRAGKNGLSELLEFIQPFEHAAVPFTSRLLDHKRMPDKNRLRTNIVLAERSASKIISAVLLSPDGIICPVLTENSVIEPLADLIYKSSYSNRTYITVMGAKSNASRFENLFRHRRKVSIDYFLLTAASKGIPAIVSEYKKGKDPLFLDGFTVRRAAASDLPALMPLRKAYEIEEVLLNTSSYNENSCRQRFSRTITDDAVFIAERDNIPAGTCCINAHGLRWAQVGGVYTVPELRSRGLSAILMAETANYAADLGKDMTLFVKKDNLPALKLYRNCGFEITDSFRISYLERR